MTKTSDISPDAELADDASVGAFCVIGSRARIARGARLSSHVVVGEGVEIGEGSRVGSFVELPAGVEVGDSVMIGAHVVFAETGVRRAHQAPAHPVETRLEDDAVVGAGAIVMQGVFLGRASVVGAGAVVTRDVADFSMVSGRPARHIGWSCICGARLDDETQHVSCSVCGSEYVLFEDELFSTYLADLSALDSEE